MSSCSQIGDWEGSGPTLEEAKGAYRDQEHGEQEALYTRLKVSPSKFMATLNFRMLLHLGKGPW